MLYKNKINPELIRLLRVYFISSDDLHENIKINNYLYEDFHKQVTLRNERLVFQFLIDSIEYELESYDVCQ